MLVFIISVILVLCVLLIVAILAQNSKGGGLTSQFGGSGASNMIGVKKTSDFLEKITWGFAIAIMVLTMGTSYINQTGSRNTGDEIMDRAQQEAPALNNQPAIDLPGDTTGSDGLGVEVPEDTTSN